MSDRFVRPPLGHQDIAEIVVRLGKIRLEGDGDPKARDGLVVAPQYREHVRQIVVHLDRTRVLPGTGAQQPDSVIEPPLLGMEENQIVQAIEVGFIGLQDGAVEPLGFAQPALAVQRYGRMQALRCGGSTCRARRLIPSVRIGLRGIEVQDGHRDCSPCYGDRTSRRRPQHRLSRGF